MSLSNCITRAMTAVMVHKGKEAHRRMEAHSRDAMASNEAMLMALLQDNKDTEYGRKYGFGEIHSIREYQERVPYTTYDDYAPYIQRMTRQGEKNLITAYPIIHYAETSGSIGVQKQIPVTDRAMDVYQLYSGIRMYELAKRHYRENLGRRLPVGRGLNAMEVDIAAMPDGTPKGTVSGSAIRKFKGHALLPHVPDSDHLSHGRDEHAVYAHPLRPGGPGHELHGVLLHDEHLRYDAFHEGQLGNAGGGHRRGNGESGHGAG